MFNPRSTSPRRVAVLSFDPARIRLPSRLPPMRTIEDSIYNATLAAITLGRMPSGGPSGAPAHRGL